MFYIIYASGEAQPWNFPPKTSVGDEPAAIEDKDGKDNGTQPEEIGNGTDLDKTRYMIKTFHHEEVSISNTTVSRTIEVKS